MPRLVVIGPGETRTLGAGATFTGPSVPRFVQIRVSILRNATEFVSIAERQPLTDAQFDRWLQGNESIELNAIPVRYEPAVTARTADASKK